MSQQFSPDLLWEITRKYSSQTVKRQRGSGPNLSRSRFNLLGVHSRKYEGLIHDEAIGLSPSEDGGITLVTKKKGLSNKPSSQLQTIAYKKHQGGRKTYSSIVSNTAKKGYRADLRQAAVARASALKKASGGKQSKVYEPKLRGGKAKKAQEIQKV